MLSIRESAENILAAAIAGVQPDAAVRRALADGAFCERVHLVAIGKAAWQMANTAYQVLGRAITDGIVITKYHHSQGAIGPLRIFEAGHPIPDAQSFAATREAMTLVQGLGAEDQVLLLVSGGGSALFESPRIDPQELADITAQLLACGADIIEMNTIRKRLSDVKGGRFAELCRPARVYAVVLSDILGDPLDMIASGPACADRSTCEQALAIAKKYDLRLSAQARACLMQETPKLLTNVQTKITGSVRALCAAAGQAAEALGYSCTLLTDCLCCEAREAGRFLASVARTHQHTAQPLAFLAGGETVVHLTGHGLGGRNQELALAAAEGIAGLSDTAVFSFGSDGTDGPTDAAGGFVDGQTLARLHRAGLCVSDVLRENDAYHALARTGGLLMTGPTGTNVNDLAVVLIRR